jgi:hypothetical protein
LLVVHPREVDGKELLAESVAGAELDELRRGAVRLQRRKDCGSRIRQPA